MTVLNNRTQVAAFFCLCIGSCKAVRNECHKPLVSIFGADCRARVFFFSTYVNKFINTSLLEFADVKCGATFFRRPQGPKRLGQMF